MLITGAKCEMGEPPQLRGARCRQAWERHGIEPLAEGDTLRSAPNNYPTQMPTMTHRLPTFLETERLVLRAPRVSDANALFDGYAQDPEVTRYTVWRPHASLAETEAFLSGCVLDWPQGLRQAYVLTLAMHWSGPSACWKPGSALISLTSVMCWRARIGAKA